MKKSRNIYSLIGGLILIIISIYLGLQNGYTDYILLSILAVGIIGGIISIIGYRWSKILASIISVLYTYNFIIASFEINTSASSRPGWYIGLINFIYLFLLILPAILMSISLRKDRN